MILYILKFYGMLFQNLIYASDVKMENKKKIT